tara:strand:- start:38 stop:325 length:288 start_codon:yes stop_codon:yes gene_type:complete
MQRKRRRENDIYEFFNPVKLKRDTYIDSLLKQVKLLNNEKSVLIEENKKLKYKYSEYKEKTNLELDCLREEVNNCYNERQYLIKNYENENMSYIN